MKIAHENIFLESNTDSRNASQNNIFCFGVTQTINGGCAKLFCFVFFYVRLRLALAPLDVHHMVDRSGVMTSHKINGLSMPYWLAMFDV